VVKSITNSDVQSDWAQAGDNVELALTGIDQANYR
jgi:selenocysteine-specific translation elongation factor